MASEKELFEMVRATSIANGPQHELIRLICIFNVN